MVLYAIIHVVIVAYEQDIINYTNGKLFSHSEYALPSVIAVVGFLAFVPLSIIHGLFSFTMIPTLVGYWVFKELKPLLNNAIPVNVSPTSIPPFRPDNVRQSTISSSIRLMFILNSSSQRFGWKYFTSIVVFVWQSFWIEMLPQVNGPELEAQIFLAIILPVQFYLLLTYSSSYTLFLMMFWFLEDFLYFGLAIHEVKSPAKQQIMTFLQKLPDYRNFGAILSLCFFMVPDQLHWTRMANIRLSYMFSSFFDKSIVAFLLIDVLCTASFAVVSTDFLLILFYWWFTDGQRFIFFSNKPLLRWSEQEPQILPNSGIEIYYYTRQQNASSSPMQQSRNYLVGRVIEMTEDNLRVRRESSELRLSRNDIHVLWKVDYCDYRSRFWR